MKLSPDMTLRDFENGYWYVEGLKAFAKQLGIPSSTKLRKDELESPGARPTYGDLVQQYILLNSVERFDKIPHGRYISFLAEYLASEKNATNAGARAAWKELKTLDAPKNYASWVKAMRKHVQGPGSQSSE